MEGTIELGMPNPVKVKMHNSEPVFGLELALGCVPAVEILGDSGVDFVLLDMQHGAWSDEAALAACIATRGTGAVPMARVSLNEFWRIGKLLDDGMMGIVVPMVDSVSEAHAAVTATRYPPVGKRSWGWGRLPLRYRRPYRSWADDEVFLAVQIESITAVQRAEQILSVDGVDGTWIGPADLALSMGIAFEDAAANEDHAFAIQKVLKACRKTGKIPGLATGSPEDALRRAEEGFLFLTAGNDAMFLQSCASEVALAVRESPSPLKTK